MVNSQGAAQTNPDTTHSASFESSPRPFPITLKNYYKMAEVGILDASKRYELLYGVVYEAHPVGPGHANRVEELRRSLETCVKFEGAVVTQYPLQIDDTNEPQPDIIVLKPPLGQYRERHPKPQDVLLIIEVSNTTLHTDRNSKLKLYAQAGIPEYWILNLPKKQLEIYTHPDPEEGRYLEVHTLSEGEGANLTGFDCTIKWW
jgi:Uma2 family endonuclease